MPGGQRTVAVAAALALLVPAALFDSNPSDPAGGVEVAVAATPAPTPSAKPLLRRPVLTVPSQATSPKPKKSKRPSPTATRDPRCGAPANPLGYGFCGGTRINQPASEVCDWFDCVPQFWAGPGYLVQCRDGSISLTGGRPNACAEHKGVRRAVTV
ncbi:hypothetical protein GCM10027614_61940 [Micromonospora vulcania]